MNIDLNNFLKLPVDQAIGQSIAILGIKGSGKSNTAAVLMEELLAASVPICVVDIAGEYHTLKEKYPNVAVIGRSLSTEVDVPISMGNIRTVAKKAYLAGASVVFDLSGVDSAVREEMLCPYFSEIWALSAVYRIPLVIFLEEAHNWIPQSGKTAVSDLLTDIAAEGRKRGLSLVVVTQRSARVDKDTLTQADIAFLHRVRHPSDLKVYKEMIPRPPRQVREWVNSLNVGESLVLLGDRVLRIQIRLRHTRHVGFTPSLDDIPARQMSLLDLL